MSLFYTVDIYDLKFGNNSDAGLLSLPSPHPFVSPIGTELYVNCGEFITENCETPHPYDHGLSMFVVGYLDNFGGAERGPKGFHMVLGSNRGDDPSEVEICSGKLIREYLKTQGWK